MKNIITLILLLSVAFVNAQNPEILRFISSASITKQIQKTIGDSTAQYIIGKGLNYDIHTLTLKLKINTPVALTDAATTTWDNNTSNVATWTMAGSRTLSISNDANGEKGTLLVTQDGTGGRIITFPVGDNLTGITQTTTANSNTMYTYIKIGGVRYWTASLK